MVSGFFTSPCDHCRMSSAVARPIRSSSKKLTSSTIFSSLFTGQNRTVFVNSYVPAWSFSLTGMAAPDRRRHRASAVDVDAARLPPGQVDPELFRSAEDVLVAVLHLDLHTITGEHLHIQAERLQLFEQHLERLGDPWLGNVLALDDRLVDLDPAHHVVGLDREQLLQGVCSAVGLHGPALHLTEPLPK